MRAVNSGVSGSKNEQYFPRLAPRREAKGLRIFTSLRAQSLRSENEMSVCCSTMAAAAATTRVPTLTPRRGAAAAGVGGRAAAAARTVVTRAGREETNARTGESGWVQKSDCAEGIEEAQALYDAGDLTAAVKTLEGALKLSGGGTKRDRSKPAELSTGERQAIFYNLMAWAFY